MGALYTLSASRAAVQRKNEIVVSPMTHPGPMRRKECVASTSPRGNQEKEKDDAHEKE